MEATKLPLVLKHPVEEQPGGSMPINAKNIELHPLKGYSNPSLKVFETKQSKFAGSYEKSLN